MPPALPDFPGNSRIFSDFLEITPETGNPPGGNRRFSGPNQAEIGNISGDSSENAMRGPGALLPGP